MKIRKRKDTGVYMLDYIDSLGKRQRPSLGTTDKIEAKAQAERILRGEVEGARAQEWTLADALDHTYKTVWAHKKAADSMANMVNKLRRESGARPVKKVDYEWLNDLVAEWQAGGNTNATCNRKLACIGKALKEAFKMGKIVAMPPIPKQTERAYKVRWLDRDEEAKLLAAAGRCFVETEAQQMRALIVFLVDTGARLGEALRAKKDGSLNPAYYGPRALFIDTKNGESRAVPLTERAVAAAEHLPDWNTDQAVHRFTRVRDEAELPDVSLHTLRHTCASRLVQGKMDLYRVKEWLGHSSIVVTERYAHLAPSSLTEGLSILAPQALVPPQAEPSHVSRHRASGLRVVK